MIEAAAGGAASGFGPGAEDRISAGTMLHRAREAAGLDVAALAVALKVPVRKLEALQADRYEELSDVVFVRALAASVCRNLKIDAAPVLQRLPATAAPRLAATEGGINAPFRSPRDGAGPTWMDQLSRPVFLAVFALLLGALVLILLPRREDISASIDLARSSMPTLSETSHARQGEAAGVATTAVAPAAPTPVLALASKLASDPAPVTPAAVTRSGSPTGMPTATVTVGNAPERLDPFAPAAAGIVVFRAKAQSWIQVTDATGNVSLRKLLGAGESAAASGALPLAVTVGSVTATDVQVRGKPFDMAPLARDNVARFEVK